MRLRLFDGARLERDDTPIPTTLPGLRLLAYLALNDVVTRSAAAGALWPESTEDHALASLRTAIWRLRAAGEPLLACDHDRLRLSPTLWVDTDRFRRAVRHVIHDESPDAAPSSELARLGRGDLLAGWDDEWVLFERERFRQMRLHLLEALSARLLQSEQYAAALEVALEVVEVEPLRESSHRAVIAVHLAEGNYVEALRQFIRFRQLSLVELGVEPSERMQALVRSRPAVPVPRSTPSSSPSAAAAVAGAHTPT